MSSSNSIGVFREEEIDGIPFHIFTSFPGDSGGIIDLPPLIFSQSIRRGLEMMKRHVDHYSSEDEELNAPLPVFPNVGRSNYHYDITKLPLEIKHPSFPFLSLQLSDAPSNTKSPWICVSCGSVLSDKAYLCPTYDVILHPFCAMKPIPILIDHPKRHSHPLTFFPKQKSLACNVCGVIKKSTPTYVCARSVFVVHLDCIYFPYVIRISRHEHRISFTYSLPSRELSCHVCRRKLDNNYGAYACNKCDDYFVHTRCALREDLWDGEELEEVPEEPEIVVEPFETIADGIILHFTHGHHLKLEISSVYDDDKFCQACVLPIYEGNYYSCVDQCCDFILHEACAYAPRKKHHPLNARSLTLQVVTNEFEESRDNKGKFRCRACWRYCGGFLYEDPNSLFRLDVRCASVSEPFRYGGHEHPLFLALDKRQEEAATCRICQDIGPVRFSNRKLNCIECDYIICFKCATLPYKAKYKHDKHLLTFREIKEAGDQSGWCEVCETKLEYSRVEGFYACDDYCCTTVHVHCLLGTDPYMKPGQIINTKHEEVHILRNNTMSRPYCYRLCGEDRCLYRVHFEKKNGTFCSYYCAITADDKVSATVALPSFLL